MISTSRPFIGFAEKINVLNVLVSGNLAAGKFVKKFEEDFSQKFDIPHVSAVSNGTTALHLALLAAGVGSGDEVITTPFTFIATANSILMAGATPVFADIDPKTLCISSSKVKECITKKTKAILAVNIYGLPCDYDEIQRGLPQKVTVIEDAAQSIGSRYKGKYSGSLGDLATFSLYATKNITSGEGGVVTSKINGLIRKVKLLRQHGMAQNGSYQYEELGYNYRMSDIQASLATAQLGKFEYIRKKRLEISERYREELSGIVGLEKFDKQPVFESSNHQFPIRLTPSAKISRDKLKQKLFEIGICTAIYYPDVLYHINHIKKSSIYQKCPNAEQAAKEVLCLPIYPGLAEDDQWYIIDSINQLLR